MIEEIRDIKSGKKELMRFGLIFGIVLAILGGLSLRAGKDNYFLFFILSPIFISCGLIRPAMLKPIHKLLAAVVDIVLGWFLPRLILCILFYLVITPLGFFMRLFGKDLLDLKLNPSVDSYWISTKSVSAGPPDKKRYENQF